MCGVTIIPPIQSNLIQPNPWIEPIQIQLCVDRRDAEFHLSLLHLRASSISFHAFRVLRRIRKTQNWKYSRLKYTWTNARKCQYSTACRKMWAKV